MRKNFRAAVFGHYGFSWQAMSSDFESLATACGTTPQSIDLFMRGFNDSLSVSERLELCRELKLNPMHYRELRASYRYNSDIRNRARERSLLESPSIKMAAPGAQIGIEMRMMVILIAITVLLLLLWGIFVIRS